MSSIRALAPALDALRRDNIFLGTSSWKYEGWLGDLYVNNRLEGNALGTIAAILELLGDTSAFKGSTLM
jgi:hypothetical protein